jgi:flagellar biosynthesis/type III secretory pathway protein FliH
VGIVDEEDEELEALIEELTDFLRIAGNYDYNYVRSMMIRADKHGFNIGYDTGLEEGKAEGFERGYEEGHDRGCDCGDHE